MFIPLALIEYVRMCAQVLIMLLASLYVRTYNATYLSDLVLYALHLPGYYDKSDKDKWGDFPIHFATRVHSKEDFTAIVSLLKESYVQFSYT